MTRTTSSVASDLEIIEVKPGVRFGRGTMKALLPDVETMLFFAKLYELDHTQVSNLLRVLFGKSNLVQELTAGAHSTSLQGYIVDELSIPGLTKGAIKFSPTVPHGEVLPEVWKQLEVVVAKSIKEVAATLHDVIGLMPGKQGQMLMKSMMVMNAKRPTIGDHRARIHHARQQQNLLILDVSGSMTEHTVRTILSDVVALAYEANAHLAIVSNTVTHWEPGNYDADSVLNRAEFGGTHYEQLAPLMDRDWGVVITVADYDSFVDARSELASRTGSIELVLDVSLVNRPTFLAECVGTRAKEVRPILVAPGSYVLSN